MEVSFTEMGMTVERSRLEWEKKAKKSSVLDILWWEMPIGH